MPSTSSHPLEDGPLSDLLRRSALCVLALAVSASLWVRTREFIDIQDYYLLQQDLPLLMAAGIALFLVARTSLAHGTTTTGFNDRAAIMLALAAVAIAYAGSWLVMERYAMSRDEDMADFAARYMQQGLLGLPIPVGVGDLAKASLPLSAGRFIAQGYWVSDYLPMNSALRAAAGLLGDRWLTGPLLLLLGIAATWNAARRLWPMQRDAGIVAVVLAATSTQLVVNAMTPYATTAHFALNAVWIACFLRGGRAGHMAAILVGLVAAGLHQFHFHMLFLSGFIAWMWLSHRRRLALLYVAAMIAYYVIWDMVWSHLVLDSMFGAADAGVLTPSQTFLAAMMARLSRLTILQPLTSAARFVAWQNVLMLPLAWIGIRGIRREENGTLPVTFAFAASVGIGLAIMPWQGFGYGYRYLHHLMPCMLLLAAAGTVRLGTLDVAPRRGLLIASCAFAIVVTAPFAMWRSHELLASFATAYRMARAAPAEVVVVDPLAGAYVQDIVRIDDPDTRPLLLDLSELDNRQIDTLCATRHVMLFDRRAAIAAGIPGATGEGTPVFASINAKQARMKQLGCTTPIPVTPSHANP